MNYNVLLDFASELGYQLAMCGAETFRIEDSICRILNAYGMQAEVFAIPNCLTVSMETPCGELMTRLRRIGYHGNDLDGVEQFSNLSRKICQQTPDPKTAAKWLADTKLGLKKYSLPIYLLGNILGAGGFCILFGGGLYDSICSAFCGLIVGLIVKFMEHMKVNQFFRTIATAFVMAFVAYSMGALNITTNPDAVIIGALMILVPGLIFTNALRDIIYGDTNSGINRIVQVFLIAAAIALGTGSAWNLISDIWSVPASAPAIQHHIVWQCLASFISGIGFFILFNIHGRGGFLCALGGMLTWLAYSLLVYFGCTEILSYFFATVFASLYAEIMARVRKCPAISYLVISAFPLIPGAGVYYTMTYAVRSNMAMFANTGMNTLAVAAVMAVGILLASTCVKMYIQLRSRN